MLQKGDRVRIIDGDQWPEVLPFGALATVDYVLPSYGKIICVLDEPRDGHTSCCLYDSQEGQHWEIAA